MIGKRMLVFVAIAALGVACSPEAAKQRHLQNGRAFLAAGQVDEAIVEFRNAVDRDELWGEARLGLAEAYAADGDPEHAYREYIRAADLMPDNAPAQLKAATYLLLAGQYVDARSRVQRLLEKDPRNVEAQIVLGNALAGLRDLEGAVAQINEAIQLEPERSQTYTNLALMKVAQGQRESARAAFEEAVRIDDTSVPARLALANFEWSLGEKSRAEQSLTHAYELDNTNVLTNRALATFYLASGRADAAEPHLKLVAEIGKTPDARLTLADYYLSMGRSDAATRILVALTTEATVAAAAETRLAGIEYAAGQTTNAHRMLDTLLQREPSNTHALLLKARWLLSEGKGDQALARATLAVSVNPRMVAAHYIRGLTEARTRRSGDAIRSFTEVLRLNPRAAVAQVHLSRLHLSRNAVDSAMLFAEEALQNAPDSLDARLALVRAWMAKDDFNLARRELTALRERAPTAAGVHALEGTLHMLTRNTSAARGAFERALQLDAGLMEALAGLTTLDVWQHRVPQARARVEARLAASPDDAGLLLLSAKVFLADDDAAKAEDALRRAIDLDPLDTANFALLGRVYADQHKLDTARIEFEDLAAREPQNIAARIMSAMIVHTQGNLAEAKVRYSEILRIEPRAAVAANNLAALYADAGENLDVAQQLAESAAEQLPANAEVLDTLGWIYHKRQLHGQAARRFLQSVEAEPDNPTYHYHLGLAYSKNGEADRARDAFRKALDLNPRFVDAQQALISLGN